MSRTIEEARFFDDETYLAFNPDVANAGCSAFRHYVEFGKAEGREAHTLCSQKPGTVYLDIASAQAVADVFEGEWSSALPRHIGVETTPGHANVFEDPRIGWMNQMLGQIRGLSVFEIGPLEAGHTYSMHNLGAAEITSVEVNPRAYLKCLAMKELLGLQRATFILGDAIKILKLKTAKKFDLIVASGVLYHSNNPYALLDALTGNADKIFIWTHYFDERMLRRHRDASLFTGVEDFGDGLCGSRRFYPSDALKWAGFSGGQDNFAVWLTKESIVDFLHRKGFDTTIGFDDADHENGPCFAICANR